MHSEKLAYSFKGFESLINSVISFIHYYRLLFVIAAMVILGIVGYKVWFFSDQVDKYKNLSIVFSLGSVIIGIFYAILNYENNQIKYKNDRIQSRLLQSYNASSGWHTPAMAENIKIVKQLYVEHKHLIDEDKSLDFFNKLEDSPEQRTSLICILNFLENVSVAIDNEILDEEYMKKNFSTIYKLYNRRFSFYINYTRKVDGSEKIWVNFTNLVAKWSK